MADSVDTQATATSEQDTQQQGQQKSFTQEEVNELMGKLRRETKMISREDITNHHYFVIRSIHNLVLNQIFVYLMKWFYFVYISPKIKFFHV